MRRGRPAHLEPSPSKPPLDREGLRLPPDKRGFYDVAGDWNLDKGGSSGYCNRLFFLQELMSYHPVSNLETASE